LQWVDRDASNFKLQFIADFFIDLRQRLDGSLQQNAKIHYSKALRRFGIAQRDEGEKP
jgi:hypothetical protein